jgi:phosphoesterase RecJ-like protein
VSAVSIDQALGTVADALGREKKTLITTHIKPDGDALGCLIAMQRALSQRGGDSIMYLAGSEPMPPEYLFLTVIQEAVRGSLPDDYAERTLIAVDCGNADRIGNDDLVKQAPRIINIDHHGDNSRFGEINLVVPGASSTAEIIYFILQRLKTKITPEIAEALYTGILVDSGRFQYSSTTPATFRVAADLISKGIDHTAIFRHVYENMPLAKVKLLCRMLSTLVIRSGGRLAAGILDEDAFREAGATNGLTEGLVDNLRAIEGVEVAALIYARPSQTDSTDKPHFRISLRSSSDDVNVQRIAKMKGGGGHRQASGFSSEESPEELIEFLSRQVDKALT